MSEGALEVWSAWAGSIEVAIVTAVGEEGRIDVRSSAFGAGQARCAVPGYEAAEGDSVLVATTASAARYVIGVLKSRPRVSAADGTHAALEHDGPQEMLRVRSADGVVLFEHVAGRSILHVPTGHLELRADTGDVSLSAAGKVSIAAKEGIAISSEGPVSIASSSGDAKSGIELDADRASFFSRMFAARADRADLQITETNLVARSLRTVVDRVRTQANEVEHRFGSVVEHAREIYREVEGLAQTRAGRLKLVADKALTLLGESTEVKAREDVKIKGEKIYLG